VDLVYQVRFCLSPSKSKPTLTVSAQADDRVDAISLNNGPSLGAGGNFNTPVAASTTAGFVNGWNTLSIVVRDTAGVVTGLDAAASISATRGLCCNPPKVGVAIDHGNNNNPN
jgi:hypothetical protein